MRMLLLLLLPKMSTISCRWKQVALGCLSHTDLASRSSKRYYELILPTIGVKIWRIAFAASLFYYYYYYYYYYM
jgi:hypothetical protein